MLYFTIGFFYYLSWSQLCTQFVSIVRTFTYPGPGALFWGEDQQQMEDRSNSHDFGRGNVEHSRASMSDMLEIIEVSQGQLYSASIACITVVLASHETTPMYVSRYKLTTRSNSVGYTKSSQAVATYFNMTSLAMVKQTITV